METVEILHAEVIWNLESMETIQAAQKQNGRISMLCWCKIHISPYELCFFQSEMHTSTLDWFRHFTQLRKKRCNDHGGSPFLKVCTCTPENLTSKVGHRVLKNFLFDRQPGEVSWKMSLLTCLSGCVHSWLCGTQPMQGCKSSDMSHIIVQRVMKMPPSKNMETDLRQ